MATHLEQAMNQLRPLLSDGLAPEQLRWAEQQYAEHVLSPWLSAESGASPDPDTGVPVDVLDGLAAELERVPPSERWRHAIRTVYSTRLATLSDAAFQLALDNHAQGSDRGRSARADELGGLIEHLQAEVAILDPVVAELMAHEFAEALLDCRWEPSGGALTSFRLGATLLGETVGDGDAEEVGQARRFRPFGRSKKG